MAARHMIEISANRRDALRWIAAREPVSMFGAKPTLGMAKALAAEGFLETVRPSTIGLIRFRLTPAGHLAKLLRLGVVMSPPMVRALIEGRKTMTRRIMQASAGPGSLWTRLEPGDLLWVREAYALAPGGVTYMADGGQPPATGWKSGRYMPRSLSRLTLWVTARPRIEPVQSISEADACAEGFADRAAFVALWQDLHKPEGWRENPSVAVISFHVLRRNIDAQ
jgi:hypothetical protein